MPSEQMQLSICSYLTAVSDSGEASPSNRNAATSAQVSRTFGGVETLAEIARGTYLDADSVNLGAKPLSGASDPRSSPLVCLRGVCVTG